MRLLAINSSASESDDSKTGELKRISRRKKSDLDFLSPNGEINNRWGVSVGLLKCVSTSLCALVWSGANALVCVHNGTIDAFHTAWFGKKVFVPALEHANHGNLFAAQKQSVS